eukprot:Plantae.Rhodophyta-Hildenbrandia_rubra.ctg16963.p1 GENE.Plantae.Rhodophyta-Hildenbrandia_rubra.ctg16963~~Plantae.Rhodophyta-Hildenbrandia_rubra.ctg16963.p1  ORF type:complete len:387 (+),score=79.30 Plantae.Rhodophyta-Hildenbrandia_rubra.ctg16963:217-1377(+)
MLLVAWGRKDASEAIESGVGKVKRGAKKAKRGAKKGALKVEREGRKDVGMIFDGIGHNWNRFTTAIGDARRELVDGGAARLLAVALLYPLDTCKTRLQVTSVHSGRALGAVLKATPKWYGGVLTALGGQLGYGVVTFGMFEVMRQVLRNRFGEWSERRRTIVAACVGDLVGSLWVVPAESLKLKLQTGIYSDAATAISTILQTGGWRNLYQGFWGQVMRDTPFRALQILAYDYARRYYLKNVAKKVELSKGDAIAVGAATGAAVGALTTPLDVIRTRIMSQRMGAGMVYPNWAKCLTGTIQAEGVQALFRGIVPRTVYMGASVALFSVGFEITRNVLKKNKLLWHTASTKSGTVDGGVIGHPVHSLSFSGLRVPMHFGNKKAIDAQ